jgi:hypothetical protein
VQSEVEKLNPRAWIQVCDRGQVPLSVLFMQGSVRGGAAGEEFGYSCFSYEGGSAVLDRGRLERLLKRLPRELFRLRGVVKTDEGTYRLEYVTGTYDLEPAPASDPGPLEFVGRGLNKGRLISLFDRCRLEAAAGA